VSRSEVSRICARLDEQVDPFRSRPLEGRYPYVWLDAKVEGAARARSMLGTSALALLEDSTLYEPERHGRNAAA
jgi:putative transposase